MEKKAHYYNKLEGKKVECRLCPHLCKLNDGKIGVCGTKINKSGELYTTIYGEITSLAMDPIEKKPLYHFYPGSNILSIGTKGCNFKCSYCQNWQISQDLKVDSTYYSPEDVVNIALKNKSVGIAYTYSEPTIWFEYVMDTSIIARRNGLKNVLVTNGYINEEPLKELLKYTDAMNIDLKSFKNETYKKTQRGSLHEVLDTINISHEKCHVELTTLIVTGINDNIDELNNIISWIATVDKNIPWHVSRYYPNYQYNAPSTAINLILKVCDLASKKLNYIYCGNIPGDNIWSNTVCPSCKTTVISRSGYNIQLKSISGGKCKSCGYDLKIVQ